MPTKRAWYFLIIVAVLYLLANQTQVGWVYIISSAMGGFWLAAFFFQRGSLNGIALTRVIQPPAIPVRQAAGEIDSADADLLLPVFHEDDPIQVTLRLTQTGLRPAFLAAGTENCPFAPPVDQAQSFFLPVLFHRQPVELAYQTHCDRRGLHSFPPITLTSAGAFGLFKQRQTLLASTETLIYPAYHPLKKLRPLENRALDERSSARTGTGSDVIGTRAYRPGDMLRQIHWRSTARTGTLIVKEFADEDRQQLLVVLDLNCEADFGEGKARAFEVSVRIAASLAYYADRGKIPFYLAGASPQWTLPMTALSWWSAMNYLARVNNEGQEPLADFLGRIKLPTASFVVVLITQPTEVTVKTLQRLQRAGQQILPIFITLNGDLPDQARSLKKAGAVSTADWAAALDRL